MNSKRKICANRVRALFLFLFSIFFTSINYAAVQNFTLYVEAGTLTINGAGGDALAAWGYSTTSGAPEFPAPTLQVSENDTVNITVVNNHTIDHNLVVQGYTDNDTTAIAPGGQYTYSFTAGQGGSFIYRDTLNNDINREMGLYGAIHVRAQDGSQTAWTGGPAYDQERTWVIGEMDKPRWNDVASAGNNVDTNIYKPNYFIINGLGGFDGMHDLNTTLAGLVGETFLVRIINGGQFEHALHFHGNHLQQIDVNGSRLAEPKDLTTINVKPNTTMLVLYQIRYPDTFPMHVHTAQMETANGVYLNGVATLIVGN